jgi:uncharacterized Zn-finger protein
MSANATNDATANANADATTKHRVIEITEADLPLHCPMPGDIMWSAHPRVFLPVQEKGEALCPYCGTLYRLKNWSGKSAHAH